MDPAFDKPWLTRAQVAQVFRERSPDSRLERLATLQSGVVDRDQAVALGLDERTIDRRVASKRLIPIHTGVYAVGHQALTPRGRAIAALLAAPTAALTHRLAGAIHEICAEPARPEVTPVEGKLGSRKTLKTYRCHLTKDDTELMIHGLRVTTLARTLLDLAEILSLNELFRAVREARVKHGVTDHELNDVIKRHPGRRGLKALRKAMGNAASEPTKSQAERRLATAILNSPLPRPRFNHDFAGKQRDVVWERARLAVEVDDYWTHGDVLSFDRDRDRDNTASIDDVEVRRFTKAAICDDLTNVMVVIAYRLGARSLSA